MRWFTLLHYCLPRTHGQLPASCLPLCVLALPSRELPSQHCQNSSFGKVKQPQVTYANVCVFFLILLCSTGRKVFKWACRVETEVILDHLDRAIEPEVSPGQLGYDVSSQMLFKDLWSVIQFRMVQCGLGSSLLFRIHYTHVFFWLKLSPAASHGRARKKSGDWSWREDHISVCLFF